VAEEHCKGRNERHCHNRLGSWSSGRIHTLRCDGLSDPEYGSGSGSPIHLSARKPPHFGCGSETHGRQDKGAHQRPISQQFNAVLIAHICQRILYSGVNQRELDVAYKILVSALQRPAKCNEINHAPAPDSKQSCQGNAYRFRLCEARRSCRDRFRR
jgi:hypothetical protein